MFFSVIIITYNRAYQLNDALFSVFSQVDIYPKDLEVIVVDNSSMDNTRAVVEKYARASGGRVRYVRVDNGGVLSVSRNAGIKAASGDYIAFLDDDDFWSEDKLATCFAMIVKAQADGVYHGMRMVDGEIIPRQVNYRELVRNGNRDIILSSVVLRKGIFNQVGYFDEDPGLAGSEDFEMWLRIFGSPLNFRMVAIPRVLGVCSPGGLSIKSAERQTHAEVLAYRKEFRRRPRVRSRAPIVRAYARGAMRCEDPEARRRLLIAAARSVV